MTLNIGIYNLHMRAMGGGEKLTLVLAEHLSLKHNVCLFCTEVPDVKSLERFFGVDLSRVRFVALKPIGPFSKVVRKVRGKHAPAFPISHFLQLRKLHLDVFINNSYGSGLRSPAARGVFMCMFPHQIGSAVDGSLSPRLRGAVNWVEKRLTHSAEVDAVNSYAVVVAISKYSADWIRKLWNREAEIVYPPCDDMGPPNDKAKIILHVGRFVAEKYQDDRHLKGQAILLNIFKQLTSLHKDGWQLHLVGSIADEDSASVAERLMQEAKGFPVFFHFNADRKEVQHHYRRAALYWHATGFGLDLQGQPAKQEHFGISTVEAMSAGAVPVVYASGGQKEIVTDKVDGFWWHDPTELMNHTLRLTNDPSLLAEISERAIVSSKRFGREEFINNVDKLMARL